MWLRRLITMVVLLTLMFTSTKVIYATEEKDNEKAEPPKKILKHIFVITLEGVSEEELNAAYTPNIIGASQGGVKGNAISVLATENEGFVTGLLTGNNPQMKAEQHGRIRTLPNILDSSGRKSVFVDDGRNELTEITKGIKRISADKTDYRVIDKNIMDLAIKNFRSQKPFFTGILLPGTEYAGEKNLPKSKQVMSVLNKADGQIGRLFTELRNQGLYENSLIIITGGSTVKANYVDQDDSEIIVPLIMTGPGLRTGITAPVARVVDVAPTIALLAGVSLGSEIDGLVLWDVLQPGEGFLEINLLQKRLKELSQAYVNSIKESYALSNEKININTEKERINQDKKKIESLINEKDNEINKLELRLKAYKVTGGILFFLAVVGYLIEYFVLRKKFLMF